MKFSMTKQELFNRGDLMCRFCCICIILMFYFTFDSENWNKKRKKQRNSNLNLRYVNIDQVKLKTFVQKVCKCKIN